MTVNVDSTALRKLLTALAQEQAKDEALESTGLVAYKNSRGVTRYGTPAQVESWKAGGQRLNAYRETQDAVVVPEVDIPALAQALAQALGIK